MSKAKVNKSEVIRRQYDAGRSVKEIKQATGYKDTFIRLVIRNYKKKKPSKIVRAVKEMQQLLDATAPNRIMINLARRKDGAIIDLDKGGEVISRPDLVNHPPHYKAGGIETIDFIEAKDLNYRLGNVIKYVSRAGKKMDSDPVQDLEKAMFYLQREIKARKEA